MGDGTTGCATRRQVVRAEADAAAGDSLRGGVALDMLAGPGGDDKTTTGAGQRKSTLAHVRLFLVALALSSAYLVRARFATPKYTPRPSACHLHLQILSCRLTLPQQSLTFPLR